MNHTLIRGTGNAAREKTTVGDTYYCPSWDATEARGIRRRLQKRAIAGDNQGCFLLLISRSVALSFLPASLIPDWLLLSSSAF